MQSWSRIAQYPTDHDDDDDDDDSGPMVSQQLPRHRRSFLPVASASVARRSAIQSSETDAILPPSRPVSGASVSR